MADQVGTIAEGTQLWRRFKEAFVKQARGLSPEERGRFCLGGERRYRTRWYKELVLPGIGRELGLNPGAEYLYIDGCYADGRGYPQVFIEYENDARTAIAEVEKLCYVRAPLKVLITVRCWPDDRLRTRWLDSITRSWREWISEPAGTVYGFVIADCSGDEGLKFHFFSLAYPEEVASEDEEVSVGDILTPVS